MTSTGKVNATQTDFRPALCGRCLGPESCCRSSDLRYLEPAQPSACVTAEPVWLWLMPGRRRSRTAGLGLDWTPRFQARSCWLLLPCLSHPLCLARGTGKREPWGKTFPPVQIAPLCSASARCSDRGQKYVFSLIFLGNEWDKYRGGVKEKEVGSVAKLDSRKAF